MKTCPSYLAMRDRKTRSNWLILMIIVLFIFPVALFLSGAVLEVFSSGKISHLDSLLVLVLNLIPFVMLYRFAFKLRGTKFLTFWLFLSLPVQINGIITSAPLESWDIWFLGIQSLYVLLFLWWWFLSLRLRSINLRHKAIKAWTSQINES